MTITRIGLTVLLVIAAQTMHAQGLLPDSALTDFEKSYLDSIDRELSSLLDLDKKPQSFFDLSLTAASSYYDFREPGNQHLNTSTQFTLLPAVAYYHSSGFAVGATGSGIFETGNFNLYQFAVSPSYAYSKSKHIAVAIVYTHFFTKDSLNFYTTPINNEIFFNIGLKKGWLLPAVSAGYGWGTQQSLKKEFNFVKLLRLRNYLRNRSGRAEQVRDIALSLSLKHNFTWRSVIFKRAFLLFTPQLMITAATQQYGFNTSYSYGSHLTTSNLLPSNYRLKNSTGLSWQSATVLLKVDYSIRSLYFQPQLILDYYLPQTSDQRLHTIGGMLIGYNF